MPTLTQFTLVDHTTINAVMQQFRNVGIDNCFKSTVIEAIMDKIGPTWETKCDELRKQISTVEQRKAEDENIRSTILASVESFTEMIECYKESLVDYKAAGMADDIRNTENAIAKHKENLASIKENVSKYNGDIKEYNTQIKELQKQIKDTNSRSAKDYKFIVRDSEVFAIYKESLNLNAYKGFVINDVGDNHKKDDEDIYRFIGGTVTGYIIYNSAAAA